MGHACASLRDYEPEEEHLYSRDLVNHVFTEDTLPLILHVLGECFTGGGCLSLLLDPPWASAWGRSRPETLGPVCICMPRCGHRF